MHLILNNDSISLTLTKQLIMNVEQAVFEILESCIVCLQKAALEIEGFDFDKHAEAAAFAYALLKRHQLFLIYSIENETVH
ncbi:Uncharacterised protein [Legionella busanensis]|uniref:Uncharacterized protein n=1 Tax=Legionella busanensis TaxID=190655 RepID=A0A378KCL7_9GAMM|nr:hypothetical protein [Legionella busanensis]STX81251.1 Uncharacterised protein [Legionella busanensis]